MDINKEVPQKISFLLTSQVQHGIEALILGLLTLSVYLFTINPITSPIAIYIYVATFLIIAVFFIVQVKREKTFLNPATSRTFKIIVFALVTGVLLWVSNTGWFLSPFVYLLYIAGISLGFLFSPSVALSFVLLLIAVLLPSLGGVNNKIDLTGAISLLMVIPLSYFLRREYVKRIEREKKILVLQEEHKKFEDTVEEVLSNKVIKMAVNIREPINDIQQIALYAKKHSVPEKAKDFHTIVMASRRALSLLKDFEENTTGKKLVSSTPKGKKNLKESNERNTHAA